MRAFVVARWPALVAAAASFAYAACVLGFGFVFRPLGNDEGVTLQVASNDSVREVVDIAVNYRHGPPLHYVLVHASLLWHEDVFGLRLPSALLGILAVALAYGLGRELIGRAGGAICSVVVAVSPVTVHLGQFSRGYTAMLAASIASLWLLMVLLRTRQARWIAPWAACALLLVASHPFGLFALFSELILLAILGIPPAVRSRDRRAIAGLAATGVLGVAAFLLLRSVYAPLQDKYGVGEGDPVVGPLRERFWRELSEAWTGTGAWPMWLLAGLVVVAGIAALWARGNRRTAGVCLVWLGQPLITLTILTASSSDFAPERHLSFLLPGYALAVAGTVLEVARRVRWHGPAVAATGLALFLLTGIVALVDDVRNFTADLSDASVRMSELFGDDDVLLTSAGRANPGELARLYGAYAVLQAPDDTRLAQIEHVGDATGCTLADLLRQQQAVPAGAWVLLRPREPEATVEQLRRAGADHAEQFGEYVIARMPVRRRSVDGALRAGVRAFRAADAVNEPIKDFATVGSQYAIAGAYERSGACDER